MLRNLCYKAHTSIGVDVNDNGVGIVVLCKQHGAISVLRSSLCECDADQEKIKFLRDFFVDNKVRKKNICIAIPAWQVIKKNFSFEESLQDIDIKMQLEFEQDNYFPGINEKLAFDIVRAQNVTVFATKQQELDKKLKFLAAAKIFPSYVEPDSFAWLRLVAFLQEKKVFDDEVGVLLITQQKTSKIVFFNQNEILYENSEVVTQQNFDFTFVRNNLEHFASANLIRQLIVIYVIGCQCCVEELHQHINLPVIQVAPFDNIDEKLWLACGLALRGFDD